jgi:hypothetical protein
MDLRFLLERVGVGGILAFHTFPVSRTQLFIDSEPLITAVSPGAASKAMGASDVPAH